MCADPRRSVIAIATLLLGVMVSVLAPAAVWAHKEAVTPAKANPSGTPPVLADYAVGNLKVGGDFTLRNQEGKLTHLRDFRTKPVLLFFGYTYCPDICPLTTAKLARLQQDLAAKGTVMQPLLVSIDPQRDTPARMKDYLAGFKGSVVGLTGSVDAVKRVAGQFHVRVRKQEADGLDPYLVAHTAYVFLLDGQGRLRYLFPADVDDALIVEGVRQLAHG